MNIDNYFVKTIKRRIYIDKGNYVVSCTGHPGTGKSYGAMDLCLAFDPNFDESRICFTIKEFFELMQKDLPTGSAIMLDEAGVAGNSKRTMHSEQVAYGEILKMMRFKRNLFVITSPNFGDYIKDGRNLIDAWIHFELTTKLKAWKKQYNKTFANLRIMKLNQYDGKTYNTRLQVDGHTMIDKIVFDLPPRKLVLAYETAKQNNFDNKLREHLLLIRRKEIKMELGKK